jgi:hypothetical protein
MKIKAMAFLVLFLWSAGNSNVFAEGPTVLTGRVTLVHFSPDTQSGPAHYCFAVEGYNGTVPCTNNIELAKIALLVRQMGGSVRIQVNYAYDWRNNILQFVQLAE